MTVFSANLNKIALLRNSRGHDYPSVTDYARRLFGMGVKSVTVHPRPDERHIRRADVGELADVRSGCHEVELNVEGYPSKDFLNLIESARPDQCTLVPDAADQLTSDHGWDLKRHLDEVRGLVSRIKSSGARAALFLDPDPEQIALAAKSGADRIELYTENYARAYGGPDHSAVLERYWKAAERAQELGLGVNAGHDLNLKNLANFLIIPGILEVSIGHAFTVECIGQGMEHVVRRYLAICHDE